MNASIVAIVGLSAFFLAYRFYARYISQKIFNIDGENGPVPAEEYRDNIDFVPTKRGVLMGHHFSSIAGAAPIVGPAVAAIWGWLPAILWVIGGVIFMGACHDFGCLMISMKHRGQSMAQSAAKIMGPRVRTLFLVVIFFLVWMVIAVFALVIASLFIKFPSAVIPVNFEIFIAVIIGFFINKKNKSLTIPSIVAQVLLLVMIFVGTQFPITLGENALTKWIFFLMIYSFIASVLPVWTLLQPRDYINSHQLFLGLGLMILGLVVTSPTIVAPAVNPSPEGAPPWFPFLFITIACGAISGFHGLVSGGTSSKQVARWKDARLVGYGSMLGEGTLALLATLAVTTGFASESAWHHHYANWSHASGLGAKIGAFVQGAGQFIAGLGVPEHYAQTILAVIIISFAATTLDTACRIQRYVINEIGDVLQVPKLKNRYLSTGLALGSALVLIFSAQGGKGGLLLWPLFAATNQMLAGLSLVVICVYLFKKNKPIVHYLLPAIFITLITCIGLIFNIKSFLQTEGYLLAILGIILFGCQLWVVGEGLFLLRGHLKKD